MDSATLDVWLFIIMSGCAIYCLYIWFTEHKNTKLPDNKLMYQPNCERRKCKDPAGYMKYIMPKVLILGILLVLIDVVIFVDSVLELNFAPLTIALMVLPIAVLVWYVMVLRKGAKRFW